MWRSSRGRGDQCTVCVGAGGASKEQGIFVEGGGGEGGVSVFFVAHFERRSAPRDVRTLRRFCLAHLERLALRQATYVCSSGTVYYSADVCVSFFFSILGI